MHDLSRSLLCCQIPAQIHTVYMVCTWLLVLSSCFVLTVCVCVRARVCVCVCARVRACVRACVHERVVLFCDRTLVAAQGCIGWEGASEAAPEAVGQAVGGGCRSG